MPVVFCEAPPPPRPSAFQPNGAGCKPQTRYLSCARPSGGTFVGASSRTTLWVNSCIASCRTRSGTFIAAIWRSCRRKLRSTLGDNAPKTKGAWIKIGDHTAARCVRHAVASELARGDPYLSTTGQRLRGDPLDDWPFAAAMIQPARRLNVFG